MEHDSSSLLFRLAREHLSFSMIVRQGPVLLSEQSADGRAAAKRETNDQYEHVEGAGNVVRAGREWSPSLCTWSKALPRSPRVGGVVAAG
jgi:hypothetical protein